MVLVPVLIPLSVTPHEKYAKILVRLIRNCRTYYYFDATKNSIAKRRGLVLVYLCGFSLIYGGRIFFFLFFFSCCVVLPLFLFCFDLLLYQDCYLYIYIVLLLLVCMFFYFVCFSLIRMVKWLLPQLRQSCRYRFCFPLRIFYGAKMRGDSTRLKDQS